MKLFGPSHENNTLGASFRKKRFKHFKDATQALVRQGLLPESIKVLDVGGLDSFWMNLDDPWIKNLDITILNLELPQHSSNYKHLAGDATNMINIATNEYDIVFSNSVIEHLFNSHNQQCMAKEVMRVGKYYYIQTPNRFFPIEPHFMFPFFQFIPKSWRYDIFLRVRFGRFRKWSKSFIKSYIEEINLLTSKDMRSLFPEGKLYKETFLFFTKSVISHNLFY